MQQTIYDLWNESVLQLTLPSADLPVCDEVRWGDAGALFTPAFWKAQLWYATNRNQNAYLNYSTGTSLHDEVTACLLGGHGVSSEMAQAAFCQLRDRGLLQLGEFRSVSAIERALRTPMRLQGRTHEIRYRFPHKKSAFIAAALHRLDTETPPATGAAFRDWLRTFDGIGWKTASWITRNWTHSNAVAVIDIHVFRAGVIAGIFGGSESTIAVRYPSLEEAFLKFAAALGEEARRLDVLIWRTMKDSEKLGLSIFKSVRNRLEAAA